MRPKLILKNGLISATRFGCVQTHRRDHCAARGMRSQCSSVLRRCANDECRHLAMESKERAFGPPAPKTASERAPSGSSRIRTCGFARQRTGNAESLALPSGQIVAFAAPSRVPLGKRHHRVVKRRQRRGLLDLAPRDARPEKKRMLSSIVPSMRSGSCGTYATRRRHDSRENSWSGRPVSPRCAPRCGAVEAQTTVSRASTCRPLRARTTPMVSPGSDVEWTGRAAPASSGEYANWTSRNASDSTLSSPNRAVGRRALEVPSLKPSLRYCRYSDLPTTWLVDRLKDPVCRLPYAASAKR